MHRFLLSRLRARFRATAVFVSFLAVFAAPQSWGLGLGEIELSSALNQEFNATIELYDAAGLDSTEILVSLGTNEDFQRVGVERFFFLTDLKFDIRFGADGNPEIHVSSARPVTEPYLNFLVEVLWPSGRMLKEYTVLLDPPTFSEAAAPVVSAPTQNRSASNSGRVQRVEPARSATQVQVRPEPTQAAQPSPLDEGLSGDEYGMTDRDDTLWSIASKGRPSRAVSVQQTMLAIQAMNPDAFINDNINLLKAGYVLRLPNEAQARALTTQQALGEVARHDQEWQAYNRGEAFPDRRQPAVARTDATSELRSTVDASAATTPASAVSGSDGELKIVAEDGDSTTGVGSQVASADLGAALEETDRLGRQVDELNYQLDREKDLATNEIAVRDRQIDVKDQQIAQLQAQLAAAQQTQAAVVPPPAEVSEPTQSQNQSAPTEAATPWWQSSMVMYGGAGVLVLLLVGGMLTARKRRDAEEENDYFDAEEAFADDERVEPAMDGFDGDHDSEPADDLDAIAAEDAGGDEFDEELEESQTSDVIGEADIYIAYGRFPQAVGLLLGVLEDEPERNDVRLKLLEVYAETGDQPAFDQHMTSLIEYCDDEEALLTARDLGNRFGEETITLDEMMSENAALPESAGDEADQTADLSDLDFSPSTTSADDIERAEPEPAGSSLDFELELDELDNSSATDDNSVADIDGDEDAFAAAETEAVPLEEGAGDQLGGDLGIDFKPDESTQEAPDAAVADSADLSAEESPDTDDVFGAAEELTIDADLEQAAQNISSEEAAVHAGGTGSAQAEQEGDLAVEAIATTDEGLLDDLEFETSPQSDEDFDFEDEGDSANTKLDLARAYIDMGDADGARDILKEVVDEGNSDQQQKAQSMLEDL